MMIRAEGNVWTTVARISLRSFRFVCAQVLHILTVIFPSFYQCSLSYFPAHKSSSPFSPITSASSLDLQCSQVPLCQMSRYSGIKERASRASFIPSVHTRSRRVVHPKTPDCVTTAWIAQVTKTGGNMVAKDGSVRLGRNGMKVNSAAELSRL